MREKIDNASREMKILRGDPKEVVEIKNTDRNEECLSYAH